MRISIVGAGIGGLTAALSLHARHRTGDAHQHESARAAHLERAAREGRRVPLARSSRCTAGGCSSSCWPRCASGSATGREIAWYQDRVRHERLTDEYLTAQSHTASIPEVTAPVSMISGWYDIFLPWQLRNYAQLAAAGRPPRLTLGPWGHVSRGMGAPAVGESLDFLREHFAGAASERVAPVRAYRTGAGQWHDLPAWPPPGTDPSVLHLHPGGGLGAEPAADGVTPYVYDPADPTRYARNPGSGEPAATAAIPLRATQEIGPASSVELPLWSAP